MRLRMQVFCVGDGLEGLYFVSGDTLFGFLCLWAVR
jgi:hypothetical protein